tara:strand:+ start:409 stop:753 length:345 start_codon:yes stop_codon:yes gene_type:complete
MISMVYIVEVFKIIATVAIFFVWFVRYKNVKAEFKRYGYPRWFRDLIGIMKISFCIMLHSSINEVVTIGSLGISVLMMGAFFTHMRMKNTFREYIASLAMLAISGLILLYTFII